VPPRCRLHVRASTAARASAKVCACLRPGPEGWRRSRQRAPLRAAPSRAELLIAARDDRLGRVLGDAQLAEDLGGERAGNGEHAGQDALVPERLPVGVVERVASACFVRGVTPRQPLRVCSSRRASPSGQAGDCCCPAGASVVPAGRGLRVLVASVPGGPHGQQRSIERRASCAIGIASWLSAVPGRAFKLVTPVRTGSVRHRKPLVLCGHERSRPASQNRRSQSAHRYDLGRRGGLASGSNPSVRAGSVPQQSTTGIRGH
jgi:hypothetical protein